MIPFALAYLGCASLMFVILVGYVFRDEIENDTLYTLTFSLGLSLVWPLTLLCAILEE